MIYEGKKRRIHAATNRIHAIKSWKSHNINKPPLHEHTKNKEPHRNNRREVTRTLGPERPESGYKNSNPNIHHQLQLQNSCQKSPLTWKVESSHFPVSSAQVAPVSPHSPRRCWDFCASRFYGLCRLRRWCPGLGPSSATPLPLAGTCPWAQDFVQMPLAAGRLAIIVGDLLAPTLRHLPARRHAMGLPGALVSCFRTAGTPLCADTLNPNPNHSPEPYPYS